MKKVLTAIGLGVLGIGAVLGDILSNLFLRGKKETLKAGMEYELKREAITQAECEAYRKEVFSMKSKTGHQLKGEWLFPAVDSQKVMVVCHGFGRNRVCSYKYALIFLKRGWNVLLYDHIHCGESEGKYTTMGYLESIDLKQALDKVVERFGETVKIATHGVSMGAATVLIHMSHDKRVAFAIADCPYADLWEELAYILKRKAGLPPFPLMYLVSVCSKIKAGFYIKQISPLGEIKKQGGVPDIPLLLIHGTADKFIPCNASKKLRAAKKGVVRLYLCEGAEHECSILTDKKRYEKEIDQFLDLIEE